MESLLKPPFGIFFVRKIQWLSRSSNVFVCVLCPHVHRGVGIIIKIKADRQAQVSQV